MNKFFTKGVKLAFLTAIVSGFSVFFNKFAVTKNIDPYQFTTLKNVLVVFVLSFLVFIPLNYKKFLQISKKSWIKLTGVGIVGGSIPFLLFFKGLSLTSSANAGFVHKTLFIWVAILAVIFLKEKITKIQYIALGVLLFSNILIGGMASWSFGYAELLIFIATILWSVENVIAKKVLAEVDPKIVAYCRMGIGSIVLLGFLGFTSGVGAVFTLSMTQWGWVFLSAGFLTAYVLTWYTALKYEKITVVSSVLVLASPITTILNAIQKGAMLDAKIIFGIILSLIAVYMFIKFNVELRNSKELNEVDQI